jgi:hypothetical protein
VGYETWNIEGINRPEVLKFLSRDLTEDSGSMPTGTKMKRDALSADINVSKKNGVIT